VREMDEEETQQAWINITEEVRIVFYFVNGTFSRN